MKLYLISRTDGCDYDEYDSFVVAAENEESALKWCPEGKKLEEYDNVYRFGWGDWKPNRESLKIECIGEAYSLEEKVIHSSFIAA